MTNRNENTDKSYYKFPNGVEVLDITRYLSGNGAQIVQYVARSTRMDGNNKGELVSDLRKAIHLINDEINRISDQNVARNDDYKRDIINPAM